MILFKKRDDQPPCRAVQHVQYLLGLSLRNVSHAVNPFVRRSHTAAWKWVQRYEPHSIFDAKRVHAFLVDETCVEIRSFEAWVWDAVEPIHRLVFGVRLSRHRNIFVAQAFLKSLAKKYGKHLVYGNGGTQHPEACSALGLEHRIHSPYEKSLVERVDRFLKDGARGFDNYYPCTKEGCDLQHARDWLNLFVDMHHARGRHMRLRELLGFSEGERP